MYMSFIVHLKAAALPQGYLFKNKKRGGKWNARRLIDASQQHSTGTGSIGIFMTSCVMWN